MTIMLILQSIHIADITVYTMLKHLHARVKARISKETYQSEDNHRSR